MSQYHQLGVTGATSVLIKVMEYVELLTDCWPLNFPKSEQVQDE
jgi:hypothetical protein